MSDTDDIELTLERGEDGRLHWTNITFHGLEGDACKDAFQRIKARAEKEGWVIDVKEYIPHQEVVGTQRQSEQVRGGAW